MRKWWPGKNWPGRVSTPTIDLAEATETRTKKKTTGRRFVVFVAEGVAAAPAVTVAGVPLTTMRMVVKDGVVVLAFAARAGGEVCVGPGGRCAEGWKEICLGLRT
jgi:hypothetical protein